MPDIFRHAHHRPIQQGGVGAALTNRYALADRLLSWPEPFRHGVVDHGDWSRIVPVRVCERASLDQWNTKRAEEVGGYDVEKDRRATLERVCRSIRLDR